MASCCCNTETGQFCHVCCPEVPERSVSELYAAASPLVKKLAQAVAGGEATQDDIELAKCILNIAIDASGGDKACAMDYLMEIKDEVPALRRLFSRVGLEIVKAQGAVKC